MAFAAKKGTNKHRSHTVEKAIAEATRDELVGLNIKIPKTKRAAFKAKAALQNKTMQDILLCAVDSYIES